jgi:hypothetical protein
LKTKQKMMQFNPRWPSIQVYIFGDNYFLKILNASMRRLQRLLALEFRLPGNVHGPLVLGFHWRGFYIYAVGHKWTRCRQSKFVLRQFQGHLRILAGRWLWLLFYVFHVRIIFLIKYAMIFAENNLTMLVSECK